jgi:hypothetical protein
MMTTNSRRDSAGRENAFPAMADLVLEKGGLLR